MVKHNKIKNTGIIFEVLIRQLTSDVLNNKDKTPAIKIIKEYFKSGSQLKKELNLYRGLFEEKFSSENKASKFLDLVLKERKTINNFVDNQFLSLDTKAFRKKYNSVSPDINFDCEYESQIGELHTVNIPIGVRFFWPESEL